MKRFFTILIIFFSFSLSLKSITWEDIVAVAWDNFRAVDESKMCYRSGQIPIDRLEKYIKTFGIKTIINLRSEKENSESWHQAEVALAAKLDVRHVDIPIATREIPSDEFINKLINEFCYNYNKKNPILIHCHWGVDRTGLASALWRFEILNDIDKEAVKELKAWIFPAIWWTHFEKNVPTADKCLEKWLERRK